MLSIVYDAKPLFGARSSQLRASRIARLRHWVLAFRWAVPVHVGNRGQRRLPILVLSIAGNSGSNKYPGRVHVRGVLRSGDALFCSRMAAKHGSHRRGLLCLLFACLLGRSLADTFFDELDRSQSKAWLFTVAAPAQNRSTRHQLVRPVPFFDQAGFRH